MLALIDFIRRNSEDSKRIVALDGIRVLLVLVVAWFHIWQQSWLSPHFVFNGRYFDMDYILRSGYLWVDGLLLLSGFLLYLPYASAEHSSLPAILPFYKKRFFRIVPSCYLCIFLLLFSILISGKYIKTSGALSLDFLLHLGFLQTFNIDSYYNTLFNPVLWTLAIEMQFYLIFPFIARFFRKSPVICYICMALGAYLFRLYALSKQDVSMLFNQLPAFLDVYANGFLGACIYVELKKLLRARSKSIEIFMSVCFFLSLLALLSIAYKQAMLSDVLMIRRGQINNRFILSVYMSVFIISACFSLRGIRFLLGNRLMRYLSDISFQFYIWHIIVLHFFLKRRIPFSRFKMPNVAMDYAWQVKFSLLCFFATLVIASLVHYLFEKPILRSAGLVKD
mgnify:CR=1 FL=1